MAWYQKSFGNDYLIVYKHRDLQGAYHEVKKMIDWLGLKQGAEVLGFMLRHGPPFDGAC